MKLCEIEDCDECPIKDEGICPGGWTSGAGGVPIEPPCTSWDGDEEVDDYIEGYYASILAREEWEDRMWEEKQKKERKNEIARQKRRYLKTYCFSENYEVKRLKKELKSYERAASLADSFATAFNITNEMFGYNERKQVNPVLTSKIESLKKELETANQKLKEKQKECRSTEEYKNIGELCIANRK